jgi:hypothetical protein
VRPSDGGIALAATLHDPPGALLGAIERWLPKLARCYTRIAVASSPPTAPRVRALLAAHGADAGSPGSNRRGPLYRMALRHALAGDADRVHYLDFDRALHWNARQPAELKALLARARRHPALLVGRSPRAYASHHQALVDTEAAAAEAFAARLGLRGRVDFLVPSFVLRRAAVERLLTRSRARGSTIYGEWAALLAGLGDRLTYVECAGLDWETPDRYREEIRRVGLAAWRRAMSTPAEWSMRRAMAKDFLKGFERALGRWPVVTLPITRVTRLAGAPVRLTPWHAPRAPLPLRAPAR